MSQACQYNMALTAARKFGIQSSFTNASTNKNQSVAVNDLGGFTSSVAWNAKWNTIVFSNESYFCFKSDDQHVKA